MVEFTSNGGTCPGYLATPEGGSGPGVLVIQEWWGLVPHIKDVCDRFAAEGFVALAPDLYRGESTHRARRRRQADDGAQPRAGGQGPVRRRRPAPGAQRARRGRRRRLLHGRRPGPRGGHAAARRRQGGGAVLRRHPVADGPARLVEARRQGRQGHYAELDGFFTPDMVQGPRRRRCRASARTSSCRLRGRRPRLLQRHPPRGLQARAVAAGLGRAPFRSSVPARIAATRHA